MNTEMKSIFKKIALVVITAFVVVFSCYTHFSPIRVSNNNDNISIEADNPTTPTHTDNYKTEFENKVSYVMIYNPYIYDDHSSVLGNDRDPERFDISTGDFSSQINPNLRKATALPEKSDIIYTTPSDFDIKLKDGDIKLDGDRANPLQEEFNTGDICKFWCGYSYGQKILADFTCEYSGIHCYIWSYKSNFSKAKLIEFGEMFDNTIYDTDVKLYGEPRYADVGGKINILFYPFEQDDTVGITLGFFQKLEILNSSEMSTETANEYGINLNKAIIHINSLLDRYNSDEMVYSTLAHELQHLICSSDWIESAYNYNSTHCQTWFNEAMSGYVEEYLYRGIKSRDDGHINDFLSSDTIRSGQSLYNFDSTKDLGDYGAVFLFSDYLASKSGDTIFKDFHSSWRNNYFGNATVSRAIYDNFSQTERDVISNSIAYPKSIVFNNMYDEWLSKLTLNFYLSMLSYDSGSPASFKYITPEALLYDEINSAEVEGGGRIIVATQNGHYEIPDDSGNGLIYIGLDDNFKPTGEIIWK